MFTTFFSTKRNGNYRVSRLADMVGLKAGFYFSLEFITTLIYVPQEIILILAVAGVSFYSYLPWLSLGILLILLLLIVAYRPLFKYFPFDRSEEALFSKNLRTSLRALVNSILLISYVITIILAISLLITILTGIVYFPSYSKLILGVFLIFFLLWLNLRPLKYAKVITNVLLSVFLVGLGIIVLVTYIRIELLDELLVAPSTKFALIPVFEHANKLIYFLIIARALGVGISVMSAVLNVTNKISHFPFPPAKQAYKLVALYLILYGIILFIIFDLVNRFKIKYVSQVEDQLVGMGDNYHQQNILIQLLLINFPKNTPFYFIFIFVMLGMLLLAAYRAIANFSATAAYLAKDNFLPKRFILYNNKQALSYGVIFSGIFSILFLLLLQIDLSIVVFIGAMITLGVIFFIQFSLFRYWNNLLQDEWNVKRRKKIFINRIINLVTLSLILIIFVFSTISNFNIKFGVILLIIVAVGSYLLRFYRKYIYVTNMLTLTQQRIVSKSKNRAIIVIQDLDLAAQRTINYATSTKPDYIEMITVNLEESHTDKLQKKWLEQSNKITLKVLAAPHRDYCRTVIEYIDNVQKEYPTDVLIIYLSELIFTSKLESIIYNDLTVALTKRLHKKKGVIVASVPWQLK